jgi:predicted RNA binding protein with dsRBD fold (UPF0201 family)
MKNLPVTFEVQDQEELKLVRKAFRKVFPEVRLTKAARGVQSTYVVAYQGNAKNPKVQAAVAKAKDKVRREAKVPVNTSRIRLREGVGLRVLYGIPF